MMGVPPTPAPPSPLLSGATWWQANEGRFPNSASVADLDPTFKLAVDKFMASMAAGGLSVTVSSTRRNPQRAYLMHYSWKVANGSIAPKEVPADPLVAITWDHGNLASSKAGAAAMVALFGIAFEPSLTSLHIEGRAIDMSISWSGDATIKSADGKDVKLGAPRSGANAVLQGIGSGFGVHKLATDPPHWSDDGH